ncbi:MAG TPA: sugar transferase [Actinobacteria bacterium]|nr:sugar transferase [Actinomycetota bacterium]
MMRGIGITLGAIVVFVGSGWLILQTNLGKRLAFLVTGAATTGWMVIGSFLFVIYAPRGIRPANLEGLDALQIRIPAIALTLASATLFVMFVLALDRYERDEP